ncbi:hypothetical protein RclHR1_06250003 [Rhizophagus clarus]|uniref:Uncharacterized protein n=1 Tax=Rhizophagus clarus TaxID=94130 RepID=A0A2Z6RT65_9GLOM|nr:hypothetical protein RclHR1_06250003 [Rhizophagus clarus]
MKKGFLLTNPASKTTATSSTTKITPTTALKSIPSDHFHDVIVDFISGLIKRNPSTIFSSIITTDLSAIDEFLTQFLATFLNLFLLDDENQEIFLMDSEIRRGLEYTSKQSSDKEDLGDPMHQSDTLMNFDVFDTNSIGSLDDVDELLATPPCNITLIPVTSLTKSQKRSAG